VSEAHRYQSKGFGGVAGFLMIAAFAFFWRPVALAYWDFINRVMAENDWNIQIMHVVVGVGNNAIVGTVLQLGFALIYWLNWNFFERYKVLEEDWPWVSDPKGWPAFIFKTLKLYSLNNFIILPLVSCEFYLFQKDVPYDHSVDGVPTTGKMLGQVLFCMMCEDFFFHFCHRALHHRMLYPHIHKIHHEHKVTIALAAQYAHPFEYVFGNLLPMGSGYFILGKRMHATAVYTWFILRAIETVDGHSGYEFSFSPFRLIPLASDYGYHVYHHSMNIGNYSSMLTIWDTVFGSNKAYFDELERKEAELSKVKAQ
jgi:sterol desaturase/sphingolipid hydroxylase (fatty acid hydroxylase superfamily)